MNNTDKAARMSAAAFMNACRLHADSVALVNNGSYPSAFQLSLLAQEELGKTYILEEFVFRVRMGERDPADSSQLLADLMSHSQKQLWFTLQEYANIDYPRSDARLGRFLEAARSGLMEKRKQDATYVGLTRDQRGRPDSNGRVVSPTKRVRREHAAEQITRVSDILLWTLEGYLCGAQVVDTEALEACLTGALLIDLALMWPTMGRATRRSIDRFHQLAAQR